MTSRLVHDALDLREPALDGPFAEVPAPPRGPERESRRWGSLFTWSSTSAPVALLLLAGIAAGPRGINLLSADLLSMLDPVVPVAVATLGVLVGLTMGDRRTDTWRLFAAACFIPFLTMLVVAAGMATVGIVANSAAVQVFGPLTWAGAICAASSLTLSTGYALEPRPAATRLIELGVLIPLLAGGLALAGVRTSSLVGAVALTVQSSAVTVAVAAAAWLLLTQAQSETEERVIAVSALLLVGGVAGALSLSGLFGGLVAGVFWRYAGRHPHETIIRDVLFVQHPLLVLVLLVAGARADLTGVSAGFGVLYLALRIAGQFAGGVAAKCANSVSLSHDLSRSLLFPGVFGVGFALNAASLVGSDGRILLAAVVVGTIGSELVALLLSPRSMGS
jgi:hypothetical protein